MEDIVIKSETLIKENEKATSNINNDLLSDNRQLQSNILSSTPFSQAGNLTGNLGDIAVKKEPIVDGNEKVEVKNENEETNTDFNSQFEILGSVITFKDEDTLMEVPQFLNNENICQSNLLSAQIPPSIEKGAMYEKVMCPSNLSSEQTPPLEEERALVVHPLKKTKIIYENLRKLLSTRHFSHKDVPLPSNISENTLNSNAINRQTIDTSRNAITSQPKDTDFVKSHSIEVTGTVSNKSLSTSDQTVQPHILKPRPHVVKRIIRFKRKPDSNINVNDDEMNKIDYNDSCHHGQSDIVVSSVTAAPHNLPNLQGVIFKDCNPSSDVPLPSNISENTLNSNAINSQPIDRNSNAGQDFVKTHSVKVTGTVITVSNKSLSASDQRVQPHILKPRQHVVKRIIRYIQKPDSNVNDDKMNKIDYNDSCHHGQSDIVVSSVTAAPQNLQNLQGVNFNDCNQCSNGFSCEKNKNDRTRDIPLTVNTVNNFQTKFNGKWEKQKEPFKSGVLGNLRKKVLSRYTSSLITVMLPKDAIETGYDCKECNKSLVTYNYQRLPMYQCKECFFSSICQHAFMSHYKCSIFHQITSNVKKKSGLTSIKEKKLEFILGCRCKFFLTNSSTEMADHLATCKVGNQTCLIMRDMNSVASFGDFSMSECAKELNTMTPEEVPVQRNITTDVQYVQTHERLDPQFKDQYSLNVAKGHGKQISTKLSDVPITVSTSPATKGGESSNFINNHKASIRVQNNELAFIGKQDDSELQSAGIVSEVSVVDSLMNHISKVRSIAADLQMNTSSENAQKAPLKTFQPKAPRLTLDPTGVRQTSISSRHVSLTLPANYYDQNKTANETPSSSTSTPRGFIVVLPVKNGQKKVLFFPIGTTSTTTNREAPVLTAPPRSDQNTTTSTIQNMASGNALTAKYDDQEQKIMQLESDKSEKTVLTLKKSNFSLCPSVRTTMAVTQVSSIVSTMGPSTKLLNLAPVDSRKYLPRPYFQKSGPTVHTMYPPTRPNNSASVLSTAFLPSRTQNSTQYDGKNSIQTDIPYSTQTDKQNLTPRVSTSSRTPVKVPFNEAMNLINAKSWDTVPMITTPVSKELVRDSTSTRSESSASTRSESSTMPESTGSIFPLVIFPNVAASQNKGNDLQQGESTHNNVSQSGESIHNNVPQSGVSQVSYLINLMPKLKSTHQSLHYKVQPSNLASNYTHNPVIVTKNSHMSNASVPANTGEREKERILWTKQQTGVSAIDQMQPVPEGHLISKGDNCMNAFANIEKDPTQSHNTEIKVEPHDKEYLQTEICRPEVVIENVEGNDYYQLYNDNKGKSISHTKSCSSSEGRLLEKTKIKEEFVPMEKNSVVFENIPTESIGSQHLNINSGLFYSSETESCPSDNGIYTSDDEICQSGMDICPSVKDICPLVKDICPLVQNIGSAVQNIGLSNTITNVDYVDSSLLLRNFPFGKDCEEEGNIAEVLKEPADHRINLIKNQLLQWKDVQGENKMQIPCSGETIARLFDNRQQQSTQDIYVCKVKQEPLDETDKVSQVDPEPLNNTVSTADIVHNENTCLEASEQNNEQLDNVDSGHNANTILKESEQNTQQLDNVVEIKQEIPMEPDEPVQQIPEPLDVNLPPVVHETEEPPMETEKAVQQIPEPLNTNLSPGAAPLSTPGLTQLVITPVYELIDGKIQIKLCLKPLDKVLNPKKNQEDNFVSVPLVPGPTTDKKDTESSSNKQGSQKNKEKKTKVQNSRGGGILPNILSSNMKVQKKVSSDTCMKVKKKVSSNIKVKKKEKGNRNKYGQYVKRCEKMLTRKKKQNEDPEMEMESVCDAVNENEADDLDTTLIESNTVERGDIQHKKENRSVINWDVDLACLEELQTSEEETPLIDSDNVDSAEIQQRREDISLNNSDVFDRREDRLHMNPDIGMEVIKHTEEDNLNTDSDVIDLEEIHDRREKNKSLKVFDVDNREEGSSLVDSDVFDRSKDRTLIYSEIKEDIGHKIKDRSLIDSDIVDPEKVQHRTEHKLLTDSDIVDSKEVQNKGDIRSLKDSDIVDSEEIQPGTEDKSLIGSDIVDTEEVQNKTEDGSLIDSDNVDSENIQYPKENGSMINSDIVDSKEVQLRTKNTSLMDSDIFDSEEVQLGAKEKSLIDSNIVDLENIQNKTEDGSLMDSDNVDSENVQLRTEDKLLIGSDIVDSKEVQLRTKDTSLMDSDIVDSEVIQLRTKDTSLMDSDIVDTEIIQPIKEDIIECHDNTIATSDDKLTGTEDSTLASTESPIQTEGDKEETTPLKRSTRCRTKSRKMTENENSTIVTIEGDETSTPLKGAEKTLKRSPWISSLNEETLALKGCMKFSKINAKITDAAYKKIHGKKWDKDDPAEQIMRLLIFQAIISKATGKLACRFCTKTFWYEKYLEQHIKLSHLEERSCDQKITDNKFIRYLHEITEDLNKKGRELERALEDKTMLAAPQSSNYTRQPSNKNEENQPKTNASNIKIILTDITCEDLALLLFVYTIDDWFCQACNRKFYTKNLIDELQDHVCGKKFSILYIRPSRTTRKFLSRSLFSVVKDWSERQLCHFRSVPACFLLNYDSTDCLEEEKSVDRMVKKFRKEFSLKYNMEVLFKKIKEVSCPNCKTKINLDDYKSHCCLPQATVLCYCNICKIGMGSGLQLKAHNFFLHKNNLQHMFFQQILPIAVRNAESQCPEEPPTGVINTESQGHQEPPTTFNIAGSQGQIELSTAVSHAELQGHKEPPTGVIHTESQGCKEPTTGVINTENQGHKEPTTAVSDTESQGHEDLPATVSNTEVQGHKERTTGAINTESQGHKEPPTAVSNTGSQGHEEPPTAALNTESQERNKLSTWKNQNTETGLVQGSEQHQEKDYLIHHVFKWEIAGLNHQMIESILRIIVFYTNIDVALHLESLETIMKKANFEVEKKGTRNSFRIRQKRTEKFNAKHLQKKEGQKILQKQREHTVDALPLLKEGEHNAHLQKKKASTADEVEVALAYYNNMYKCKICDKGFSAFFKMRDHIFEEHPDEKNRCKVCKQMFRSRQKLREHVKHTQNYGRYTPLKEKGGKLSNAIPLQKQGEHTVDALTLQKEGEHTVDTLPLQKQGEHRVDTLSLQKQGEHKVDTLPLQKQGEHRVDTLPLQKQGEHRVDTLPLQKQGEHRVDTLPLQKQGEHRVDTLPLQKKGEHRVDTLPLQKKGEHTVDTLPLQKQGEHRVDTFPLQKQGEHRVDTLPLQKQGEHRVDTLPLQKKRKHTVDTIPLQKQGEHTVDVLPLQKKRKHTVDTIHNQIKRKDNVHAVDKQQEKEPTADEVEVALAYYNNMCKCKICDKGFSDYAEMRDHMFEEHPDEKNRCKVCKQMFRSRQKLRDHVKHKQHYVRYISLEEKGSLDLSYAVPLQKQGEHRPLQKKRKHTVDTIHNQIKRKHKQQEKEPTADEVEVASYLQKDGEHTVSVDQCLANDNCFYKCKYCNKGFSRLVKLKNHVLKDHPDERNRCKICHKIFGSYHILRRHVKKTKHYTLKVVEKTKTKKVILCEFCGGKFYKWTSLNYHIKHYHSGDKDRKPRECVLCGKVFVTVAEFASHRKNDHSTQCKICLKTFCDVLHLERHHKLKHLQRNFKCPKCWRTYAFEYMLKMHIKFIHEDYKPYSCDICNYKCYMKNAITSHMKNNH